MSEHRSPSPPPPPSRTLDAAPLIGVLYWNLSGGVTGANDVLLGMLGYSREDLSAGRIDWYALTPEEWRVADADGMVQVRETGRHLPFEKEFRRADGARVPVLIGSALYPDSRTEGVSFVLDISDRKSKERGSLERTVQQRIAGVLEGISDAFVALDADWRITYMNPQAERLAGGHRNDFIGRSHWEVWFGGVGTELEEQYRRVARDRSPAHFENLYDDGTIQRWFDVRAFPDEGGGINVFYQDITERRRTEDTLRERDARFQAVTRATKDAVWDWDLVNETVFWNEGIYDPFGYPPDQVISDPSWWYERIHPEDADRVVRGIHRVIDGEAGDKHSWTDEYRLRRADGTYAAVLDRGYVVRDEAGTPLHMVGAILDLSERKEAEDALRDSAQALRTSEERLRDTQARLESALLAGEIATWSFDVTNDKIIADANLARLFSLTPEEAAGGSLDVYLRAIHPEDRVRVIEAIGDAVASRESYDAEYRVVLPDGSYRWLAARGKVMRDAAGRADSLPGVVVDITARKSLEAELRQSEARFRLMADSMPQIAWTARADGGVEHYNRGWYDYTGLTLGQTREWGWQAVIHPDDVEHATGVWVGAIRAGTVSEVEYRLRRNDGQYRWHLGRSLPVHGEDGQIVAWVGTATDIQDRVELEKVREEQLRLAQAKARQEAVLYRIGAAMRSALPPADIQGVAVELLGKALGADRCYFAAMEAARDQVVVGRDYHTEDVPSVSGTYPLSRLAVDVDEIFGGGKTLVVRDTGDTTGTPWGDTTAAVLASMRVRSLINVPFYNDHGVLVAALCVAMADTPREWTADEVELAQRAATETRAAVEAARIQLRERTIAQQLQDALLPPAPEDVPGLALASFYRPALEEAGVGGDGFDVFEIGPGRTALCVFDLSGKGLKAASAVATVRNSARFALYNGATLAGAVTTLNHTLVEHQLLEGFATLFLGIFDVAARTLTYVNAGQEPGLLWRAGSGAVEQLPPTGPVLGGFESPTGYAEETLSLSPGDVLAVFTDGLTEVGPNRKDLLEIDGVSDLFRASCAETAGTNLPQPTVDRLVAAIDRYAGGGIRDDIALLVGVVKAANGETWD